MGKEEDGRKEKSAIFFREGNICYSPKISLGPIKFWCKPLVNLGGRK